MRSLSFQSTADVLFIKQPIHHPNEYPTDNMAIADDVLTKLLLSPVSIVRRNLMRATNTGWDLKRQSELLNASETSLETGFETELDSTQNEESSREEPPKFRIYHLKPENTIEPHVPPNKQHVFFYVLASEIQKYRPKIVKRESIWTFGDKRQGPLIEPMVANKKMKPNMKYAAKPELSSMPQPPSKVRFDSFSNSQLKCTTIDDCGELWYQDQKLQPTTHENESRSSIMSKHSSNEDYTRGLGTAQTEDDLFAEPRTSINMKLVYEHRRYVNRPLRFMQTHKRPNLFPSRHQAA